MDYPKRPKFFANRFIRVMSKMCAAQEIGSEACWMLTVIAITEDARGYRPPGVTFFNEQLMPMAGFGSVDSLARARKKAVDAGWLHYEAGGKGRAGKYWVIIPEAFVCVDDAPSDEGNDRNNLRNGADNQTLVVPQRCGDNPQTSAETTARQPADKCGDNPQASAEHSSCTYPIPIPNTDSCSEVAKQPSEPPVMIFPCVGKDVREWPLVQSKIDEYRESFLGIDVESECRKARQWCIDNPTKRKTFKGMPKFLSAWMGRAQDSPRAKPEPTKPKKKPNLSNWEVAHFSGNDHDGNEQFDGACRNPECDLDRCKARQERDGTKIFVYGWHPDRSNKEPKETQ